MFVATCSQAQVDITTILVREHNIQLWAATCCQIAANYLRPELPHRWFIGVLAILRM